MPKQSLSLRAVKADGTDLCILPHRQNLQLSVVRSDVGAISFDYPKNGKNFAQLGRYVELRVLSAGAELRGCRFLLDDDSGDEAHEDGEGAPKSWTGRTWGDAMLDKAFVWPTGMTGPTFTATGENPGPAFTNATPGAIVKWLIDAAKARGCFTNLVYDFTNGADSMGTAWPLTISKQYEVGTKYGAILADLRDSGLIEYEFVGRTLRMYVQGYLGHMENDLTQGANPVILRKARDLTSAPVSRTGRDTVTVALVQGDGGIYAQQPAGAGDAPFRVEGFFTESGVSDMGTLQYIGTQRANANSHDKSEHTYELPDLNNTKNTLPWRDFYLGDWVWGKTGQTKEALRVAQITLAEDDSGVRTGSVVLGDLIEEKALRLNQKIDRLEAGIGTKASGAGTLSTLDHTTPNPPGSFVLTTDSYQDTGGTNHAIVFASWAAVTQNTDGTPYTDGGGYRLQWRKVGDVKWSPDWTTTPDQTDTSLSGLPLNTNIEIRLRAYDLTGHLSTWVSQTIVTAQDTVAPPQPSAPVVDTTTFAGVARIIWDGKTFSGGAMPPDFAYVEVHTDVVAGFIPSDANQKDMLLAGGGVSVFSGSPNLVRYAKLVAVDRSGNKSVVSAEVAFTIRRLVDTDAIDAFVTNRLLGPQVVDTANIKDLAVGTAQMKDLSVVNAKIGTLAVNDANIANMNIGKLQAGYLGADMTVSARIKTADFGARAEMNSTGFHVFDASNNEVGTLAISGGSPLLQIIGGKIKTGISGLRWELDAISGFAANITGKGPGWDASPGGFPGLLYGEGSYPVVYLNSGTFAGGLNSRIELWGGTTASSTSRVRIIGGGAGAYSIDLLANGGIITLTGIVQVDYSLNVSGVTNLNNNVNINGNPLTINFSSSGNRGIVMNGASGQSQAYLDCVNSGGTRVAAIASNGNVQSTGSVTVLSDRKAKQKIKYHALGDALSRIAKIKPASFEYKHAKGERFLSFIAQDVQAQLPEAVVELEDEYLGYREGAMVALHHLGLHELITELEALKNRVKELEAA